MLTLLLFLARVTDQELTDALHQVTNAVVMFTWIYAAIWIPMFAALIAISALNYLQYKRMCREANQEEERSIVLRKDLYESMLEHGGDIEAYVNLIVEKSLKK